MGESGQGVARLACFELWGGNSIVAHPIELPGLQGWVSSTPFGQAASGGDVHYLSVCSKGEVSRIALADVAGHGESASAVADRLRQVLRHHTDHWDQSALMRELNEAFRQDAKGVQFATAVVLGFYCVTGELLFQCRPPTLAVVSRGERGLGLARGTHAVCQGCGGSAPGPDQRNALRPDGGGIESG